MVIKKNISFFLKKKKNKNKNNIQTIIYKSQQNVYGNNYKRYSKNIAKIFL